MTILRAKNSISTTVPPFSQKKLFHGVSKFPCSNLGEFLTFFSFQKMTQITSGRDLAPTWLRQDVISMTPRRDYVRTWSRPDVIMCIFSMKKRFFHKVGKQDFLYSFFTKPYIQCSLMLISLFLLANCHEGEGALNRCCNFF